ncbi:hypothetical protein [Clostridium sp.]|uniref:hypothetical protein n=1 Tax=Clostridium sp. TaxID=1506 RepID=UPI003216F6FA
MKYIDLYNKMIEIFQNKRESGIRARLNQYFEKENNGEVVRDIISKNMDFKNSTKSIEKFIDDFYNWGGITEDSFQEFKCFVNENKRPINRVVFGAGDKIDTTLDVSYNEIMIEEDTNKYLVYQNDSYVTVTWDDLYKKFGSDYSSLVDRTLKYSEVIEKRFYQAYINHIHDLYINESEFNKGKYPSLLPQYALKNRIKTIKEDGGLRKVLHRVDFAMILNGKIILIEIDGPEHYSTINRTTYREYYNADFDVIGNERCIDRELTLEGYEIYRFLNKDVTSKTDQELTEYLKVFFDKLFKKHNIIL